MSRRGFPSQALRRMHDASAAHVARGELPGLMALVGRGGETHVDVIGAMSPGGAPLHRDTIFRISSMSKPVTAAAAMVLVDEGTIRLHEPVDHHLPELAGRHVLRRVDGPLDDTVPAARPITVRDLLTFTMGFGLLFAASDAVPAGRYGWDGGMGTSWFNDPNEGLTAILITSRQWASPVPPDVCREFWTHAYDAVR